MSKLKQFLAILSCIMIGTSFAQDIQDEGDFIISYESSNYDLYIQYANDLKNLGFFESKISDLNDSIALPYHVGVVFAPCDVINAFWNPNDVTITMCYELKEFLYDMFRAQTKSQQELEFAVLGAMEFIFYHELGHALVDIFDIPFTGREEDAVDQFSTVFLISQDLGVESALSGASFFYLTGSSTDDLVFWGEHSLDQQRFYDIVCLVYGSDPETYSHLILQEQKGFLLSSSQGYLPKERADRCPSEYFDISRSWSTLLNTYVALKEPATSPEPQANLQLELSAAYAANSLEGILEANDDKYSSNEYYDTYTLDLKEGQEVRFELVSHDFNTWLIVKDPNGNSFYNDDYTNDSGFASRLTVPVVNAGEWTIEVTSYEAEEVGTYLIGYYTVDNTYNSLVEGTISESSDIFSETGEYFKVYDYRFEEGKEVVIALSSLDFDPYLFVVTPSGENFVNDDFENQKSLSRLEFVAPETGDYKVYVTTHNVAEVGSYQMVMGFSSPATPIEASPTPSETPVETPTQEASEEASTAEPQIDITDMTTTKARSTNLGSLEDSDDRLDSGEYIDYYSIDISAGQEASFTLVSADFETYLAVMNPEGDIFEEDELADDPNRSKLTFTATTEGTWVVFVTTMEANETGNYLLSIKK